MRFTKMDKSKATEEATEEAIEAKKDEVKSAKSGGLGIIAELTHEAERIIAEASEAAGREAKQELERILDEYERKTKQIVLKIREETKAKTADIASRLSDTIMQSIDQASSEAVGSVVAEFNTRAGEISRKVETEAASKTEPAVAESAVETPEAEEIPEASVINTAETKASNNGSKSEQATEDDGIELKQSLAEEDFNQWLGQ